MPTAELRPRLAREGIFNARDLGGLRTDDGRSVAPRRLVRADSLHRARTTGRALRDHGVVRVLDLRDERERDEDGVLVAEGIEVLHHPVLDPTFEWFEDDHAEPAELLGVRYRQILDSFPERFSDAFGSVVEVVAAPGSTGAVAYHCAVGKDRTGLLTALLLGVLGVPDDVIVADYARSARATAVQVGWLWTFGHPAGQVSDSDLELGVWSARPATMVSTLRWLGDEYGGPEGYVLASGVDAQAIEELRAAVLVADD